MPCLESIISRKDKGGEKHMQNTLHKVFIAGVHTLNSRQSGAKGSQISVSIKPVWAT